MHACDSNQSPFDRRSSIFALSIMELSTEKCPPFNYFWQFSLRSTPLHLLPALFNVLHALRCERWIFKSNEQTKWILYFTASHFCGAVNVARSDTISSHSRTRIWIMHAQHRRPEWVSRMNLNAFCFFSIQLMLEVGWAHKCVDGRLAAFLSSFNI